MLGQTHDGSTAAKEASMTPDAAIVLTAAFAAGLVARMLRLPPLLGFLAAGFALAGADAVGSGADLGRPPVIDLLADLGVTLLLFAVGLHLDVRRLLRREVWLTTGVHSLLMVGIGVGFLTALSALGVAEASGLDLRALALIALALSFSSTVFVVKVLDERNESRSRYGQIAIGVLVVQDVFAVVFVAVSHGSPPSPWAFGLLLLIPARRVIVALWERAGRAELQVLFGVLMAFVPGYALFDALGLKGDLGALAMGMLLAGAARSDDLAKSIFGVKELLLVAFFLSIGLHGVPDLQQVLTAALLLLLLPVQTLAYVVLLSMLRMRRRTAVLTALVLANSSEFALVVMATAQDAGLVTERWVTTTAVTVALSFVLSSAVNAKAEQISDAIERRWPDPDPESLDEAERPIPLHDVDALVLGMGRVGSAGAPSADRARSAGARHRARRGTGGPAAGSGRRGRARGCDRQQPVAPPRRGENPAHRGARHAVPRGQPRDHRGRARPQLHRHRRGRGPLRRRGHRTARQRCGHGAARLQRLRGGPGRCRARRV
jgi:glutathione-regulated potassium-efflux system ancillary protein KefC